MPFLSLNGITVPVESATDTVTQVYGDARGYLGFGLKNRVARKRTWSIKTIPMDHELAQCLAGIIACRGDVWGFDDLTLFSQKGAPAGVGLLASALPVYVPNNAAADGSFNPCSPTFSAYAIYTQAGRVNSLPTTNDASFETSNPLTTTGSPTVTLDATRFYQGAKSIKVTDSGATAGNGVTSPQYTVTASTAVAFSIMVYNGTAGPLPLTLTITGSAGNVAQPVVVPVGGWYRIWVGATTPSTGKLTWSLVSTSAVSGSWWIDGAMLEYAPNPSPWVNVGAAAVGPTNSSNGVFAIPFSNAIAYGGPDSADSEVSLAFWTQFSGLGDGQTRQLFVLRPSGSPTPQVNLTISGTPPVLTLNVLNEAGASITTPTYGLAANAGLTDVWHHLVVNIRTSPHAGSYWTEVILDGVRITSLAASAVMAASPINLSKVNWLQMPFGGTTVSWSGQINEMAVNPYCLPLSVAQQFYATQPTVRPLAPRLIGNGTMLFNQATVLQGSRVTLAALPMRGSATNPGAVNPMATLSFTLDEV